MQTGLFGSCTDRFGPAGRLGEGPRAVLRLGILLALGPIVSARAPVASQGAAETKPAAQRLAGFSVPAGTRICLRLETPVSTKVSHLNQPIAARVVRDVPAATPATVAIPVGATARGRLERLIPSSNPSDRARARLRFTELEIPGEGTLKIEGRVADVENARESVLEDGTIQGVLPSEMPLALLEKALGGLGPSAAGLQEIQQGAFGKPDTSINYPAGADFTMVLTKVLDLRRTFPPFVSGQLPARCGDSIAKLLSQTAQRTQSKDGAPGDPLNLVIVGSQADLVRAFQQGGWSEAEGKNSKAVWETVRAIMAVQGYGAAPVSQLYLYGRHEDLAFERMLNTFAKRHHLRLWRAPAQTPDGREIWMGAATHDIGLDLRPGVISHAIDPNLDDERAKVGSDLAATGQVAAEQSITRSDPLLEGLTATGVPWKTDGKLLVIDLKLSDSSGP